MTAIELTAALGGRWHGGAGMARCVAHEDGNPSLSIRDSDDGRILIHCFAGCDQNVVVDALRARSQWPDRPDCEPVLKPRPSPQQLDRELADAARRDLALRLWGEAKDAHDTIVETYLVGRGLTLPADIELRFQALLLKAKQADAR